MEVSTYFFSSATIANHPLSRACGPGGAWPGGRAGRYGVGMPEAQLARKGALGFGGEEFALRVMGENDSGYCLGRKPSSG